MEIVEIAQRKWDYILFKSGDEYILTVMFFDQIDYPRSFKLELINQDEDTLKKVSEEIRSNYSEYESKEIHPPIMKSNV